MVKRRDVFERNLDGCLCVVSKRNEIVTIVKWLVGENKDKYSTFTNGTFERDFTFKSRPKLVKPKSTVPRQYKSRKDGLTTLDIFNYFKAKLYSYPDYRHRVAIVGTKYSKRMYVMFDTYVMMILYRSKQMLTIRCVRKALSPKMFNKKTQPYDASLYNPIYKDHKVIFEVADLQQQDRDVINGVINDSLYYFQRDDVKKPIKKFD
jgi:hypothetical protein